MWALYTNYQANGARAPFWGFNANRILYALVVCQFGDGNRTQMQLRIFLIQKMQLRIFITALTLFKMQK